MAKGKPLKVVYNAEPLGYSKKACENWIKNGFYYQEGSWLEIDRNVLFKGVTILIVRLQRYVDHKILDRFPDLEFLVSATTGHDHIDEEILNQNGIKLVSLRGYNEFLKTIPSTAEHTWALIMSMIRNIVPANISVRDAKWDRDQFRGKQLANKTLGILGFGRTGSKVAEYADAFGMKILFYDPYKDNGNYEKVESLSELASRSDLITIHVHLTKETRSMVDESFVTGMRQGSFIVNTSRAGIWDEETVVMNIESGHLGGVAADVLSTELQNVSDSPLWQCGLNHSNVLITPHLGGATWEAMWACEEFIINEIL